ncbi:MAG: lysine--tRNA ligase, partial [Flavobacteriales bacterium]
MRVFSDQELERREKLDKIRALGIEAYPADLYPVDHYSKTILDGFDEAENNFQSVCLAGRLMSDRLQGKAGFLDLQDSQGRIGSIFHYINGKFDVHQRVYVINDFSQNVFG